MKTGKLPENALKRSVLRQIGTRGKEVQSGAGIGRDCAILAFPEEEEIAVCMQEAALSFMSLGELIQKCANNLGAGGSRPFAFMVTLLLPEDSEEADVRRLMEEAERKVEEMSRELEMSTETGMSAEAEMPVKIVGGQTRITGGVSVPMAVVTGFGRAWEKTQSCRRTLQSFTKALPGQDVVLSKWIGLQGTAMLAERKREALLERYPAWLAEEAEGFKCYLSVLPEAETAAEFGVSAMHDASEGGIFGALWELAEGAGTGLTIDMRKLPLRQETVEVCECCNVNPYELLSGGCLIMTTEDGPGLVAALEKKGIPAEIVGKVTDSNDRILVNGEEIRYMDRPQRDEIYKYIK